MEKLYDIQEHIEFNRVELDDPSLPAKDRWYIERMTACYKWQLSCQQHFEASGAEFFDFREWNLRRLDASITWKRSLDLYRRKMGDREILGRLESLEGVDRGEGTYKITRARRRVVEAVVSIASRSGVLYCGYDSLARAANVSARTAFSVRAELERLGVLVRIRTGGKAADGSRQSNKYIVKWCVLRDMLGVAQRWGSRYRAELPLRVVTGRNNVYFNFEGFAHYSKSARQMRRLRQRARERCRQVLDAVKPASKTWPVSVEAALKVVENFVHTGDEQAFCALTALTTLKNPKIFEPVSLPLSLENIKTKNGTRQSRSSDGDPTDHTNLCYNPSLFKPATRQLMSNIKPERLPYLLAEIDQIVSTNPSLETQKDRQAHAESILRLITDGDKTFFIQQVTDPINAANAAWQ